MPSANFRDKLLWVCVAADVQKFLIDIYRACPVQIVGHTVTNRERASEYDLFQVVFGLEHARAIEALRQGGIKQSLSKMHIYNAPSTNFWKRRY